MRNLTLKRIRIADFALWHLDMLSLVTKDKNDPEWYNENRRNKLKVFELPNELILEF